MKPPPPAQPSDTAITEAATWCLRLHDDECTAQDHAAFEHWLQADPLHAFEYAKMLEIWALSDQLPNHLASAKKLLTHPAPRKEGTLDS
ncbi:DUF4880 domain-containing protein [Pseudomonas sp. NC26]|uniref:DUF4880 domain-containing protein n=1 Tax=Pseudomonas putida TaxID=303 RepID=A0A7W2QHV6_PSEPU|nr:MULTISPECIES: DUF4880 domain-containing protein [Pseudomonas]MBA6115198.1 DUF4880 domain-containing protein [Pseudomonas putida]MCZ9639380.1 DUF4880 domain-containing protein [Pseudomonas putida]MEC4874675.1 DUF4880 domain-containing protein [Pseudomonas sp. NC26]QNL88556.1 Periplasmic ferric-dicitrate binding protein FecR [Pseudomonas putida]